MTFENMDPVHAAQRQRPRPVTIAVEQREVRTGPATTEPTRPTAPAEQRGGPRTAADIGTPAVLDHRVVALEAGSGESPLIVHTADGDRTMMPVTAQVWARAGRLTVVAHDGSELKMTVLGVEEAKGLRLGERWPANEPDGKMMRFASAAVHDVGDVLTFPAWLARTTRVSGQRNAAMHALIRRLRKESPDTKVFIGSTFGSEHHRPELEHPYDHRGIVGREGYPTEL